MNFVSMSVRDNILQSVNSGSGAQLLYHLMDYGGKAVRAWSKPLPPCTEFKNALVYFSTLPKYLRSEYKGNFNLLATRGK
jgi:hypothetical protein